MKNKMKIAVIGAMDCEVDVLKSCLKESEIIDHCKLQIYKGTILNHEVIIAKSGVGKVNAALNTQYLIDTFNPDYIINTGVAGGIAPELNVGDIVIGTALVQHDFDVTALGYAKGYLCTGIDKDKPTMFYCDERLIDLYTSAVDTLGLDNKIHKGIIATGDTFVAGSEKKAEIRKLFNATATEMEGCAIAQTAYSNDIPFIVIRAISDLADGSAPKSLAEVESKMAEFSASTIETLLNSLQ